MTQIITDPQRLAFGLYSLWLRSSSITAHSPRQRLLFDLRLSLNRSCLRPRSGYDTPLSVGCSQRPTAARHPPNNRERKEFRHFTADKSTRNIQANSPGKTQPVSRIHLHASSSRRLRWPGRFHRFVRLSHPFHPLCGFDSWLRRSRCTRSRISSKLRPRFCSFKWVIPQTSPNPFPKNQCTSPVDYRMEGYWTKHRLNENDICTM